MPSVINTNIASLIAQNNLNTSQASLQTSLQRLSSGLRINSAKDDAAGMAISDRMSAQINGLNQAVRNSNDGISLAQTAEGGLSAATDLLQRMRQLAVQSANSTNSAADRASLQSEVSQLKSEIDRVATSTSFNGINLLDGSFSAQNFQVGANAGGSNQISIVGITNLQTTSLGTGLTGAATLRSGFTSAGLAAGDVTLNGVQVGATAAGSGAGQSSASAWALANAINTVGGASGVTAAANATVATVIKVAGAVPTGAAAAIASGSFSINGVSIGAIAKGTVFSAGPPPVAGGTSIPISQGTNVAAAINQVADQTGVTAAVDATGFVTLTSTTGNDINVLTLGSYLPATLLADTGLTGVATGTGTNTTGAGPAVGAVAAGGFTINGVNVGAIASGGTVRGQGANAAAAINLVSGQTGVTATSNAITGAVTLTASDGRDIVLGDGTSTALLGTGIAAATFHGTVTLNSSNPNGIVVSGKTDASAGLGAFVGQVAASQTSTNALTSVDVSTAIGATAALAVIDAALSSVDSARGAMGAIQNRFSSVVTNLQTTGQNLTAARSRIQDTDFAAETSNLTRAQILQQAGTAMLAQANALPQQVLTLLK